MGDYEAAPRSSSGVAAFIRGLIAAALTFGVYWLVVGGGTDGAPVAVDTSTTTPAPVVTATTPPIGATTPATGPTPTDLPTTPTPTPTDGQIGAGLSIQVLDGAGDADATLEAVAALRALGFTVVVDDPPTQARQPYSQTTVFATAGFEEQAAALVEADPRFTTVDDNPGTLDDSIDLHIVIGEDWPSSGAGAGSTADPAATPTATPT